MRREGHEEEEDESFRAVSTGTDFMYPQWRSLEIIFPKAKRKRFTPEDVQVEL